MSYLVVKVQKCVDGVVVWWWCGGECVCIGLSIIVYHIIVFVSMVFPKKFSENPKKVFYTTPTVTYWEEAIPEVLGFPCVTVENLFYPFICRRREL